MADDGLMTIGEFSRLVGMTPSALRYYDDCDLLVPAHVAATGYRLYADGQRERATIIRLLREAGLSLGEVRQIVDGPSHDLRQVVRDHLARTAEQARTSAAVLHQALRTMLGSEAPWAQASVRGPELASGVRQVRHAADRDRPAGGGPDLGAVLVEIDLDEVRLVTTDRYRLALRTLRGHQFEGGCARVGVAADDLLELVPALLLADTVVLRVDGEGLTCVITEQRHVLTGRGDDFPDYQVLLDGLAPADATVVADRGGLLRALRPAGRGEVVLVGAAGDGVVIAGPSADAHAVAGTWLGPPFRAAFDAAHLEEALAVSVGPDVIIELADGPRPAVVRSADHGSFTTLVMPRVAPVSETTGAFRSGEEDIDVDPDNPVVRLCAQGMEAEQADRPDDARALFDQAWEARRNDYEGCIAAHYLARQQPDDEATFRWNLTSLRLADAARAEEHDVDGFASSLHLNMASSYQQLGDRLAALAHLDAAGRCLDAVPEGPYKDMIRAGIGNVTDRLDA